MKTLSKRERLLASSIIAGVALMGGASVAQAQTQPQSEEVTEVSQIVVTGSRIRARDTVGNSPIATVSAEALSEIGSATVETYLNALPQVVPHGTRVNNNPGYAGAAYINLRDLGPSRGLVLVDGRRLVPGSSSGATNLSILPPGLVERVELITGGASAVYGADAVAGVVNFILKKDFEGLEFTAQTARSQENDANEYSLGMIAGTPFANDRGHITFAAGFTKRDAVYQGERDAYKYASYHDLDGVHLNGSPTTPDGTFSLTAAMVTPENKQRLVDYFTARGVNVTAADFFQNNRLGFNPDGSLFVAGNGTPMKGYKGPYSDGYDAATGYYYNFNPVNLLLSPLERYNFYTDLSYELAPNIEFYGNALFSTYSSLQSLAESPASFAIPINTTVTLNGDVRSLLQSMNLPIPTNKTSPEFGLSRRTNELGPRAADTTVRAFQLTGGFRGDLPQIFGKTWSYDVFASHGRYQELSEDIGYPNGDRIRAALAGCPSGSPLGPVGSTGAPSTCVPLNPFGAGSITPTQVDYIMAKGQISRTDLEQTHAVASVSGELFDLPAGPVGFAVGLEYRDLSYFDNPASDVQTGNLLGGNSAAPVKGGFDVAEVFAELKVPILADLPFIHRLEVEAGYRYSEYSLGFETEAWKYGGEWAPTEWLRFRGLVQRAVRAPSIGELYSTRQEGYPQVTTSTIDPCNANSTQRTGANAAQVLALCQAQSSQINATWIGSAAGQQFRTYSGGNINLQPETADSFTAGFVLKAPASFPSWTQAFGATVDYWSIEIQDVISTVGYTTSLSRCYSADYNPNFSASNVYCQNINRDSATGMLTSTSLEGFISQRNANLAASEVSGVDLGVSYQAALADYGLSDAWGRLGVTVQSTWFERNAFQSLAGNPFTDYVGTIGSGSPGATALPEWKTSTRIAWSFMDDFSLSLRWQYIGGVETGATGRDIPSIDAQNYFYLSGRWQVNDTLELFGGIDNLTDVDPPFYSGGFQFGTDPSTYDVIGRYFYVGVKARF
ncbi:TonB-dependent receptor domain-containing protein [Brevundimonas sp.]|uniref:TonB-dependent receptor domain-containing protein n=1 Tax=Brevundimonas sp. TaxID=1871086 RepID=UPI0028A2BA33|nr:TonB-dependent receptor [Brevundimonas sp.]